MFSAGATWSTTHERLPLLMLPGLSLNTTRLLPDI